MSVAANTKVGGLSYATLRNTECVRLGDMAVICMELYKTVLTVRRAVGLRV